MGHITTDRLTDAWKLVNEAERCVDEGVPSLAIEPLSNALKDCQRSAYGMDCLQAYVDAGGPMCREQLGQLKSGEYTDDDVRELIEDTRTLLGEIRNPLESELHKRLREGDDDIYDESTPDERMPTAKFQNY